jgi:hypothetical protein
VSRFLSMLASATLIAFPQGRLAAQQTGTTITLTVSPTYVNFPEVGGQLGAAVARLGVSRDFTRLAGGEVSVFALAPLGGVAAQPGCPQSTKCISLATPDLLSGALTSLFAYAGESGLRFSAGVGTVGASGGEGFENRSSFALLAGADWIPRTTRRFAPTLGVQLLRLSSPVAGARHLLLPGAGVRF